MRKKNKFLDRYNKSGEIISCGNCEDFDKCNRKDSQGRGVYQIKYGSLKLKVCDYWVVKGTSRLNEFKAQYKIKGIKTICDNCIFKDKFQCRMFTLGSEDIRYEIS